MIRYRTQDAPTANNRTPIKGERQWTFTFTLEDGSALEITGGLVSYKSFKAMFEQEELDDLAESNPTGN